MQEFRWDNWLISQNDMEEELHNERCIEYYQ